MLDILRIVFPRLMRRDEAGATATEYAILVGFIAFAIILGVTAFGTQLSTRFVEMGTIVQGFG